MEAIQSGEKADNDRGKWKRRKVNRTQFTGKLQRGASFELDSSSINTEKLKFPFQYVDVNLNETSLCLHTFKRSK